MPAKIAALLYLLMGFFAIIFGVWVLFDSFLLRGVDETLRRIFGGVIIAYGIFRIYSGISGLRKSSNSVNVGTLRDEHQRGNRT
jgi:hypothetical protein